MKIKIPKTIKVGGFDYRITFDLVNDEEGSKWGWWRNFPQEIELSKEAPEQRRSHTFIHELLHAIDDTYLGNKLSEDEVIGLTTGLHQILEQLGIRFVKG